MAGGRENMSSVDYDQTQCTDLSTEVKSKLKLSEKGLLKWTGNFELLKKVIGSITEADDKWTSPGGGSKQFKNSEVTIRWYTKQHSLKLSGAKSGYVREQLAKMSGIPLSEFDEQHVGEESQTETESRCHVENNDDDTDSGDSDDSVTDISIGSKRKDTTASANIYNNKVLENLQDRMNQLESEVTKQITDIRMEFKTIHKQSIIQ